MEDALAGQNGFHASEEYDLPARRLPAESMAGRLS